MNGTKKLAASEEMRLREISRDRFTSFAFCPATTAKLHSFGLIDKIYGRARINEAGKYALDQMKTRT